MPRASPISRLSWIVAVVFVGACSASNHRAAPGAAQADSGASAGGSDGGGGGTISDAQPGDSDGAVGGRCMDSVADGGEGGATLVCSSGVCFDPNWAQWPMPNSPVDVATGAPNPESYAVNGDGTVTDRVTGLMWQQAASSGPYTWASALSYCTGLTLAGHTDWRAPTYIELVSIVDYAQLPPAIDPTAFPATPWADFWSSTPLSSSPSNDAWEVYFSSGDTSQDGVLGTNSVRCVRVGPGSASPATDGSAPAPGRYAIANGTVYDTRTQLTWQQATSASPHAWADAKSYCASLSLNGTGVWRLPTTGELLTIVDVARSTPPAVDCAAFPGASANPLWSSTPTASLPSNAWGVYFDLGSPRSLRMSSSNYVRCVL